MTHIGTIAGIPAAFGARWDDAKNGARLKSDHSKTVGFYDDKDVTQKMFPAPAVISAMLDVDDTMAAYSVFYHDDNGEIFGSIVYSAGQVAPLSEVLYETQEDWENAIVRSTRDSNIDQVYLPEGAADFEDEKHRIYAISHEIDQKTLPKIVSTSNLATILIVAAMLLVIACIPLGAWVFIAKPFEQKTTEAKFVVEKIKPDYAAVLGECETDLRDPWPAPPEWSLVQEGCVSAPELAKVSFPKPADQTPYAYRYYELDGNSWDEYLSRASFLKMAERFPGQVLEGTNQFVLIMPYELGENVVDDAYMADTDPAALLRQSFIGAVKLSNGAGAASIRGFTDLELSRTIERLQGQRLTPVHVYRDLDGQQTGMEISAEKIDSRRVRIN